MQLELPAIVSHLTWVLGTVLVLLTLSHLPISLVFVSLLIEKGSHVIQADVKLTL